MEQRTLAGISLTADVKSGTVRLILIRPQTLIRRRDEVPGSDCSPPARPDHAVSMDITKNGSFFPDADIPLPNSIIRREDQPIVIKRSEDQLYV